MEFNAKKMREEALPVTGRYRFTVLHTREKISSNGNNMFIMKMRLENSTKQFNFFSTIIVTPKMFWQLEHFCNATGMSEKIDQGRLMAQDCDGREGYLELAHRTNKETGEMEAYVKDYIVPDAMDIIDPRLNDDIPPFD